MVRLPTRKLGLLLLSAWLIMQGLISLIELRFDGIPIIMGVLAIAAGVCLLLDR